MAKKVQVEVYRESYLSTTLKDMIAALLDIQQSIPENLRDDTTVELDCEHDSYSEHYRANFSVAYWRDETEEETDRREKLNAMRKKNTYDNEVEQLRRLTAKYAGVTL